MEIINAFGSIFTKTLDAPHDEMVAALRAFLIAQGFDEVTVDQGLPLLSIQEGWWSDTYGGFGHDCSLHLPEEANPEVCFPDMQRVWVFCGLPQSLSLIPPGPPIDLDTAL